MVAGGVWGVVRFALPSEPFRVLAESAAGGAGVLPLIFFSVLSQFSGKTLCAIRF